MRQGHGADELSRVLVTHYHYVLGDCDHVHAVRRLPPVRTAEQGRRLTRSLPQQRLTQPTAQH